MLENEDENMKKVFEKRLDWQLSRQKHLEQYRLYKELIRFQEEQDIQRNENDRKQYYLMKLYQMLKILEQNKERDKKYNYFMEKYSYIELTNLIHDKTLEDYELLQYVYLNKIRQLSSNELIQGVRIHDLYSLWTIKVHIDKSSTSLNVHKFEKQILTCQYDNFFEEKIYLQTVYLIELILEKDVFEVYYDSFEKVLSVLGSLLTNGSKRILHYRILKDASSYMHTISARTTKLNALRYTYYFVLKDFIQNDNLYNDLALEILSCYTEGTKHSINVIDNFMKYFFQDLSKLNKFHILNSFNPIEGGETTFYYIRLIFKNRRYYKVGVTLNSVEERYQAKDFNVIDKVLYEQKLTHANTIEKQILQKFSDCLFPLAILSSGYSEVFDQDVLGLDE